MDDRWSHRAIAATGHPTRPTRTSRRDTHQPNSPPPVTKGHRNEVGQGHKVVTTVTADSVASSGSRTRDKDLSSPRPACPSLAVDGGHPTEAFAELDLSASQSFFIRPPREFVIAQHGSVARLGRRFDVEAVS